ncbi:23S rRNA (uracil(1939)-C(5))-methyltransferase RlmD [Thermicanus aegyptius]|uniref:23S rRNA (uracil(1939)-C(5))-methyltransferase RlmD n=1 Tax=Thermicanus aegyptius TaxID=94009 RepID=UPI001FE231CA|nr:23S rRNA (uracil(1939)-C(5))-methyltransferase RlmD [Thermicanus aegyptius]
MKRKGMHKKIEEGKMNGKPPKEMAAGQLTMQDKKADDPAKKKLRTNGGNPLDQKEIPVEKNMEIPLSIERLNHEGEGVGRYEGYTLFVPGALPGEEVRAKVVKVKATYGYGKMLEIIKASPERRIPPCPIYKRCGGCTLQHLSYEGQLQFKRQLVVESLERIGKLEGVPVHPTLGMADPWRYRNKVQVPIGEREGGLVAGFYAPRSHELVEMEACLIQHEKGDEVIRKVKEIASRLGIPAYDEKRGTGLLRHVLIKVGFATGEIMVVLVTNGEKIPRAGELVEGIRNEIDGVVSIVQNINPLRTNVILGEKTRTLWGRDVIYDQIGDVKFAISARSFYQVNPIQTKLLYEKAVEYAGLTGTETVIDAYCGIGTISLFLARKAGKVYGVEEVAEAIADAKKNAALNGIDNVEFAVGKAEEVMPRWKEEGITPDVIVVDPPRKGCDRSLLDTMIEMKPRRIVYVSCNPSTLARDLHILEEGGYKTVEVQPVDMFPQTAHVECCVLLKLKGISD